MEENIHSGHRKRTREAFLKQDIELMADHEILEIILFYAYPRRDTNEIAHRLINAFGSIDAVIDAPFEELVKIKDVGENAATLLMIFSKFSKSYLKRANRIKNEVTLEKAEKYLKSAFFGKRAESIVAIFCDSKDKYLNIAEFDRGSSTETSFRPRELMEAAIRCNASRMIIAHNHPNGFAVPSSDDIKATVEIREIFQPLDIELTDHIIISENDSFSMRNSKKYRNIFL